MSIAIVEGSGHDINWMVPVHARTRGGMMRDLLDWRATWLTRWMCAWTAFCCGSRKQHLGDCPFGLLTVGLLPIGLLRRQIFYCLGLLA